MTPIAVAATLLIYILVLLGSAYYSSRRALNSDYFVAGRALRWQVAALAMITAAMSGVTFVSVPGSVAADSFSYMQMVLGFTVGQMVIAFVLIPLFYRLKVVSLYEYLEVRFGGVSHKTGAWFFFVSKVTIAALRLYIMCVSLQILLFDHYNIPFAVNVALMVAVVWLATRRGGVKSLVWTDSLKSISLIGSLVLSIVFIVNALGWGGAEFVERVGESSYSQIFFFEDAESPKYFWKMFFAGLFTLVAMTGLDQDMMQCNLSCVDYRHAQKNIIVTALCQIVVIMLFLVLGVLLYEYAAVMSIEIPAKSDQLFSLIAVEGGLPAIVGVLFVLGLTSSTFASTASSLTALTTSCTIDLLGGARCESEEALTRMRHRVHSLLALIIAALIVGVGSLSDQSVINVLFKFVGYTYGPILGLFAFGILTRRRVRDGGVWCVAVASLVVSVVGEWIAVNEFGYRVGFELLIYNAMLTFLGMWALSVGRGGMQIGRAIQQNRRPLLMLLFMVSGVLLYRPLSVVDDAADNILAPLLIFGMLFVTFCRVRLRDLRLTPLHIILVLFQLVASPLVYYLALPFGEIVAQGAMVCFLAPIAMGAVAIGALLGAEVLSIVSYTLICNIAIAFVAPYYLDIFGNGECDFVQILSHVAPLLLAPLACAQILKRVWSPAAKWIGEHSQMSFYMWLLSMLITLARTTNFVIITSDTIDLTTGLTLAAVALVACVVQYGTGRLLGSRFGDRVAGAQSLGQKNTVFAVWLAQTFLFPVSSIAPTAYIIWQNLVNSFQIYMHDRAERRGRVE